MRLRPIAMKSIYFSHSKCYKNNVSEGNYLKLAVHTFFRDFSSTYIPVFENLEILGIFYQNKTKC